MSNADKNNNKRVPGAPKKNTSKRWLSLDNETWEYLDNKSKSYGVTAQTYITMVINKSREEDSTKG